MAQSPMMDQFFEIKEKYPDCILFYRVGDFYEMFYEDAKIASKVCDLVLTGKDCGQDERAPMCGVPFHSAESYIGKLINAGYKVGICEQVEDPKLAKGLVRRDVIRVVTPGTLIEAGLLSDNSNNYICCAYVERELAGIASADVSTGELYLTEFEGENAVAKLADELCVYSPKELVINLERSRIPVLSDMMTARFGTYICDTKEEIFDFYRCKALVEKKFSEEQCLGDVLASEPACRALGALLAYLNEMNKADPASLRHIVYSVGGQYLEMDINARRSLELTVGMHSGDKKGSLLSVIDKTRTPMGSRLIKNWIERPLLNPNRINVRLDAVQELFSEPILRDNLKKELSEVSDIERLVSRIAYGTANAKDLKALEYTIDHIPVIMELLGSCRSELLVSLRNKMDGLGDVKKLIAEAIKEDPPFSVREGGLIKDGYDANVDYLRSVLNDSQGWLLRLETTEKEATGIPKLKIGYNKVFGYYIEVTNSFKDKVPDRYIRKQTLTNCERYITEELKNMESSVLGAKEKSEALEFEIFSSILSQLTCHIDRIQTTASAIAELDVLRSFAQIADVNNYSRPEVDIGEIIDIKDGRHPVVEAYLKDSMFVPNDTYLDLDSNKLSLITGPNMAGKSTYMRQTALIVILAQMGSFVPARSARIGVADRLFTRIGASDDVAFGKSTFMLEMSEVAYILKNATRRSFIIYDEIGRGTSTYDGMSIARAVAEYTAGKKCGARTLFATHYHELTDLEGKVPGIVNYNIKAKKHGNDVVFLRKIVRGCADDSYGIEVAYLAGVPKELVTRAKQILAGLEENDGVKYTVRPERPTDGQISFEDTAEKEAADVIRSTDIDTLSPIEALNTLYKLKNLLK